MRKSMIGKNCDRRKYLLTSKDNEMFVTDNLYKFCLEHNIATKQGNFRNCFKLIFIILII